MNINDIEKLEEIAANAREQLESEERKEYENAKHKEYAINDWVTDGDRIGRVQRIIDGGYINVDIKNGDGGTLCQTKVNKYEPLSNELIDYYESPQSFIVELTGEDIEALFMSYAGFRNLNPSKTKTKIIDALEKIRFIPDY